MPDCPRVLRAGVEDEPGVAGTLLCDWNGTWSEEDILNKASLLAREKLRLALFDAHVWV